jgi:hypothetical protein
MTRSLSYFVGMGKATTPLLPGGRGVAEGGGEGLSRAATGVRANPAQQRRGEGLSPQRVHYRDCQGKAW